MMTEPERKRKKKRDSNLTFDASKVFDGQKDDEVKLDLEVLRYSAQKGEGGDRRV